MKKMLIVLVMVFFACFSFNTSGLANENFNLKDVKQEYEEFLANEIRNAEGQERKDLVNFSKRYHSSSTEDQYKIVEFFHSPDKVEELANLLMQPAGTLESGSKTIFADGIEIVVTEALEENNNANNDEMNIFEEYRVATYKKSVSAWGVKVMEHTSTLNYSRTRLGGSITGISASDHRMTRNFTLNSVSYTGKSHTPRTFPATWARSTSNVTMSIISKYIPGGTYASGTCGITVDNNGKVTGYFSGEAF